MQALEHKARRNTWQSIKNEI